jgi:RNA polymerase sigma factor (sigma-70 family)
LIASTSFRLKILKLSALTSISVHISAEDFKMNDGTLLEEFAKHNSDEAFTALVERHANAVYSYCLRQLRDPDLAEETTHADFIILSKKISSLSPNTVLSGWLFKTARYAVANARKMEFRRRRLEKRVKDMANRGSPPQSADSAFLLLDEGLERLSENDRHALLLKFIENRTLKDVCAMLQISETEAEKRISRGLESLRQYFCQNGVVMTVASLSALSSAAGAQIAPQSLTALIAQTTAHGAKSARYAAAEQIAHHTSRMMFWKFWWPAPAATAVLIAALFFAWANRNATPVSPPNAGIAAAASPQTANSNDAAATPVRNPIDANDAKRQLRDEIAALTSNLTDPDAEVVASRKLDGILREKGQTAFDIFEDVASRSSQDSSAHKLVDQLTTPQYLWTSQTGPAPFAANAPVVSETELLQSSDTGTFVLNRDNGKLLWSKPSSDFYSSGCFADQYVIAAAQFNSSHPHHIVTAFDREYGRDVWSGNVDDLIGADSRCPLDSFLIFDDVNRRVLFGTNPYPETSGHVVALDLSGTRAWAAKVDGRACTPLAVAAKNVCFCCGYERTLNAFQLDRGTTLWQKPVEGITGPLAYDRDRVFAIASPEQKKSDGSSNAGGEFNGFLYCFNAKDGALIWTCDPNDPFDATVTETVEIKSSVKSNSSEVAGTVFYTPGVERVTIGGPVVTNAGKRVVSQNKVFLFGADAANGKLLWKSPCKRWGVTSYAVKDDVVYAGSDDGKLLAVQGDDGRVLWALDLNTHPSLAKAAVVEVSQGKHSQKTVGSVGAPAIYGDTIYVTTAGGWTLAFKLPPFQRRTGN